MGIKTFHYNCGFFYLQVYQSLLQMFWNFVIRSINTQNHYLLLTEQSAYYYEIHNFLITGNILCSDIHFAWYHYNHSSFPAFFVFFFGMFRPFIFSMITIMVRLSLSSWYLFFICSIRSLVTFPLFSYLLVCWVNIFLCNSILSLLLALSCYFSSRLKVYRIYF